MSDGRAGRQLGERRQHPASQTPVPPSVPRPVPACARAWPILTALRDSEALVGTLLPSACGQSAGSTPRRSLCRARPCLPPLCQPYEGLTHPSQPQSHNDLRWTCRCWLSQSGGVRAQDRSTPGGQPSPATHPSFPQCGRGSCKWSQPEELCPPLSPLPLRPPALGFCKIQIRSPDDSIWAWGLGSCRLGSFLIFRWTRLSACIWLRLGCWLSLEPCLLGAFHRGPVCWEEGA